MALPAEKDRYTFADVLSWDEDVRVELINGLPYLLAPPLRIHQEILMEISNQIKNFLNGKNCRVYPAPFGVRLFSQEGDTPDREEDLLEPDISVICDRDKLDQYGCKGAPDMIVEILSPSSLRRDRFEKYILYERAGVREYWIVDPDRKLVQAMVLEDGQYHAPAVYTAAEQAPVTVLEGCVIDLAKVFEDI